MFKAGCDFVMINRAMFEVKSFSRIAIEREVLNGMELYFGNRCAVISLTKEMIERTGVLESELEGVPAMTREIEGVEIGITLRFRDNGFKISVRTGEEIDASKICGKLGGGGHRCAAGCFVEGDIDTAKKTVLKIVAEALGEVTE